MVLVIQFPNALPYSMLPMALLGPVTQWFRQAMNVHYGIFRRNGHEDSDMARAPLETKIKGFNADFLGLSLSFSLSRTAMISKSHSTSLPFYSVASSSLSLG